MKHLPRPCLGRGRLALVAFALSGVLLLPSAPASAQDCGGVLSTSKGNLIGSAAGAAAGGLLGNQFGSGTGKGVMTGLGVVGGALAGGYAGRSIEGCDRAPHRGTSQGAASQGAARPAAHRASAPAQAAAEPRTCRFVTGQTVIDGREQPVEGVACLEADGVWRTASGAAAQQAAEADLVIRAQQRLREQGFYVRDNIDGRWGPATSTAVRNFQRANGLASSGQLDGATRTALGLDAAPAATASAAAAPTTASAPAAPSAIPVAATPAASGE